jgi:PA14 domain
MPSGISMVRPRTFLALLASAAALWAVSAALVFGFRMERGLWVEYFENTEWAGNVVRPGLVPNASTASMDADWPKGLPDTFSTLWSGYLAVGEAGRYEFWTNSDDGSRLYVDGQLIVDNGGRHGMLKVQGTVALEAGPHQVTLEYFQGGGAYGLEWLWAREGATPTPVPDWLLSPRPITYRTALVGRAVRVVRSVSGTVALLVGGGFVFWWERRSPWTRRRPGPRVVA